MGEHLVVTRGSTWVQSTAPNGLRWVLRSTAGPRVPDCVSVDGRRVAITDRLPRQLQFIPMAWTVIVARTRCAKGLYSGL